MKATVLESALGAVIFLILISFSTIFGDIFEDNLVRVEMDSGNWPLLLVIIFFFITSFYIIVKIYLLKKIDIFAPWILFPIFYTLIYAVGALKWIAFSHDNIGVFLLYSIIGILSYIAGNMTGQVPARLRRRYLAVNMKRVVLVVKVLIGIGVVAGGIFFAKAGGVPIFAGDLLDGRAEIQHKGSHILLYLARLIAVGAIIHWVYQVDLHYKYNTKLWNRRTLFVLIFAALFLMSTSSRSDLFFLVFIISATYYNSMNKSFAINISLKGIFLFIAIMLYGFYRVYVSDGNSLINLERQTRWYGLSNFYVLLIYFFNQISVYAYNFLEIIRYYPGVYDNFYGAIYFITLSTALPGRQETVGEILKNDMGFIFSGGGVNPTIIGELYLDFGIANIVIWMYVYGIIATRLYNRLIKNRVPPIILIYSYFLFCQIISTTGGFFSQLSRTYFLVIFLSAIMLIHPTIKKLRTV